ncbi:galanin receptor type 1b [Antennarius striatus]|uniref:galanin receptor type 1b n=1 Tax=Antennarius striatus TaxID=241820 RepID=UPI0035B43B3C
MLVNDSSGGVQLLDFNLSEVAEGRGPEAVVVPFVFGLIFIVGVMGNSLVMVVMGNGWRTVGGGKGRRSGSPTNIFVLNLSVADLLFLLFCVPFHATIYSLPDWVFGAFLCKFGHYFSSVSMLVSIFTLAAMSVDRYIAVVHSGRSPSVRTQKNTLAGVGIIWILSLLCSVPVAQHQVILSHPAAPNSTFCWQIWAGASRQFYKVAILVLGFLVPLLLISCCYTKVRMDGWMIGWISHPSTNTFSLACPDVRTKVRVSKSSVMV